MTDLLTTEEKDEFKKSIFDLRKKAEEIVSNGVTKADIKEYADQIEKLQNDVDNWEDKANEIADLRESEKKMKEEFEKKLEDMEAKYKRPGSGSYGPRFEKKDFISDGLFKQTTMDKMSEASKKFWEIMRAEPKTQMNSEQRDALDWMQKTLTIGDAASVGYFAPPEFSNEVIQMLVEKTSALEIGRVVPCSGNSITWPVEDSIITATRAGENYTLAETTGYTADAERAELPDLYTLVKISRQALEDVAIPLEARIKFRCVEAMHKKIGVEFIVGTGVNQCEGMTLNATLIANKKAGSSSAALNADDIVEWCDSQLMEPYNSNAVLLMSRATRGKLRLLKTSANYIWIPNMEGSKTECCGKNIVICPDVAAVGSSAYAMILGDFKAGYYFGMRISLDVQRLDELYAPLVGFFMRMRVGGKVVNTDAISLYQCGA